MLKKLFGMLFAGIFMVSLVACGTDNSTETPAEPTPQPTEEGESAEAPALPEEDGAEGGAEG